MSDRRLRMVNLGTFDRALAEAQRIGIDPRTAPVPRTRAVIEGAATKAAMCDSSHALATLQIEVLLDIRDLIGECAVRLSELSAERAQ